MLFWFLTSIIYAAGIQPITITIPCTFQFILRQFLKMI